MKRNVLIKNAILIALTLYVFLISIKLMGGAFKLFGNDFAHQLITFTTNPLVGLFIGILATSLVQSSSATTSVIVGLVASNALSITNAIPMIMGANIGTSITNTLVSLAHIHKKDEFKKAFEGLPMVNNGVIYMSPRFMEVVADIQTRALSAGRMGRRQNAAVIKAFSSLMNKKGNQSGAFVILNEDSGVLTTGTSALGGKEIVASTMMMPVGIMAGIAIPSFAKAKNTSQKNACINNLRMIDAAKEHFFDIRQHSGRVYKQLKGRVPVEYHVLEAITHYGVYSGEPLNKVMDLQVPWFRAHLQGKK